MLLIKNIKEVLYNLYTIFKIQYLFNTYNTPQFRLATLQISSGYQLGQHSSKTCGYDMY